MKFSESLGKALTKRNASLVTVGQILQMSKPRTPCLDSKQGGLTLVEILIALAVLAIVLTVVATNVRSIIAKNRTTPEINELSCS